MRCVGYSVCKKEVSRFEGIEERMGVAEFGVTFI
jgi:hypothetical protein